MIVIYCIESLDGRKYIGSTVNFERRKYEHLQELRLGSHYNQYLQNYYSKHGENSLTFSVLLEIENPDMREQVEQECILAFRSNNREYGFNLTSDTSVTNRSDLTKEKIRRKALGRSHSQESKEKMRRAKLGKTTSRKGKTYEEIYGAERAEQIRIKIGDNDSHRTPEFHEKQSLSHLGKKQSRETIEKRIRANTGQKRSHEIRKKMSESAKRRYWKDRG